MRIDSLFTLFSFNIILFYFHNTICMHVQLSFSSFPWNIVLNSFIMGLPDEKFIAPKKEVIYASLPAYSYFAPCIIWIYYISMDPCFPSFQIPAPKSPVMPQELCFTIWKPFSPSGTIKFQPLSGFELLVNTDGSSECYHWAIPEKIQTRRVEDILFWKPPWNF